MTDGNTHAIAQHLDEREEWDALQEVTAELEQAESDNILLLARIEELEATLQHERLAKWKVLESPLKTRALEAEAELARGLRVGKELFEEQKKARKGANAADAKLEIALEALEKLARRGNHSVIARNALAILKGKTE